MENSQTAKEIVSQGKVAFKALQKFQKKSEKKQLFPEDATAVYLDVKYKKLPIDQTGTQRKLIQLPHSDRTPSNSTVCLMLPDLDRSEGADKDPDVDKQAREWAELLRSEHGLTGQDVAKIFTYTQLKREYSQPADKVKLSNTYDIFMVDSKLMKKAFSFLGSSFRKPSKMPLPINAEGNDIAEKISNAYNVVSLNLDPLKDGVTVRIGNLGQSVSHLTKNLGAIVSKLFEHCPGGANNIRVCHIKTTGGKISLPIFVDFGSANDVQLEKSRKRTYEEVYGECSTLPKGLAVKVRADGRVIVVNETTKEEVVYPNVDDEWEAGDDLKPTARDVSKQVRERAKEIVAEME